MTTPNENIKWAYVGDGVTVAFAFDNKMFVGTDVGVYLDGLLQAAGYSVAIDAAGIGNVTFDVAPLAPVDVVLASAIPAIQSTDFVAGEGFDADGAVEDTFDRAMRVAQQTQGALDFTLRLQDGDPALSLGRLPLKSEMANKLIGGDSAGDPIAIEPTDASSQAVTATGANISRLLAERWAGFLTPDDFASNTTPGVTDMTAAIQAAADTGLCRLLPDTDYLITDQLAIASGNGAFVGSARSSRILLGSSFPAKYAFLINDPGGAEIEHATLKDFQIDGANVAGVLGGIDVRDVSHSLFANLLADNFADGAPMRFRAESGSDRVYNNCVFNPRFNANKNGIEFRGASGTFFCTRNLVVGGQIRGNGTGVAGSIGVALGNAGNTNCGTHTLLHVDISNFETGIDVWGDNNRLGAWCEGNGTDVVLQAGVSLVHFDFLSMVSATQLVNTGNAQISGYTAQGARYAHDLNTITLAATEDDLDLAVATATGAFNGEIIRVNTDAGGTSITGMNGGIRGRQLKLCNINAGDLTLVHQSGSSAAANRFLSPTGANIVLGLHDIADLWYDGVQARWRIANVHI